MKNSKKATSIIEAIIVLLIVTMGVTGTYSLFIKSTQLTDSTAHKIQAIQIAKQGIEGFSNIRDTNWIRFSSDYKNCWNTLNYNKECLGQDNNTYDVGSDSYIIYRENENWLLKSKTTGTFGSSYINNFQVGLNNQGIYSQTGTNLKTSLKPVFTREIIVSESGELKMKIKSIVQWIDNSSSRPHKVVLEQTLHNWQK